MWNSELVKYYVKELDYLNKAGSTFGKKFPDIAEHLGMYNINQADPQTAALLESVAFLIARLQLMSDNLFPVIAKNLISVIYKGLLDTIPTQMLVKLHHDVTQNFSQVTVNVGTVFFAKNTEGISCNYTSTNKLDLLPLRITHVKILDGQEIEKVGLFLKLDFEYNGELKNFAFNTYISGNSKYQIFDAVLSCSDMDTYVYCKDTLVYSTKINYEALSNYNYTTSHHAFEVLRDYCVFNEKFLNFTLELQNIASKNFAVYIPIHQAIAPETISVDNFHVNVVHIENLYHKNSEPISVNHESTEFLVISDIELIKHEEIKSIDKVIEIDKNTSNEIEIDNFFNGKSDSGMYWVCNKKLNSENGNNTFLSFVDVLGNYSKLENRLFYAKIFCLNKLSGAKINSTTNFHTEVSLPINNINLFGNIAPTRYLDNCGDKLLILMSLLSRSFMTFTSDADKAKKNLTEILSFFSQYFAGTAYINEIDEIRMTRKMKRNMKQQAWIPGISGISVDISFSTNKHYSSSLVLLGMVISKLLTVYTVLGSFIEVNIYKKWQLLKTFKSVNEIQSVA